MARLRRSIYGFARARQGTAAIEFVFIAPVMLLILFGSIEVVDLYRAERAATLSVSALADLTARTRGMDDTQRDIVFAASGAMLAPFNDDTTVGMRLSSLLNDDGDYEVQWSVTNGHGPAAFEPGDTYESSMFGDPPARDGDTIIVSELNFDYTPRLSRFVVNSVSFDRIAYRRPRYLPAISYPSEED